MDAKWDANAGPSLSKQVQVIVGGKPPLTRHKRKFATEEE